MWQTYFCLVLGQTLIPILNNNTYICYFKILRALKKWRKEYKISLFH